MLSVFGLSSWIPFNSLGPEVGLWDGEIEFEGNKVDGKRDGVNVDVGELVGWLDGLLEGDNEIEGLKVGEKSKHSVISTPVPRLIEFK